MGKNKKQKKGNMTYVYAFGEMQMCIKPNVHNGFYECCADAESSLTLKTKEKINLWLGFEYKNKSNPYNPYCLFLKNSYAYEGGLNISKTENGIMFNVCGKFKISVDEETRLEVKKCQRPLLARVACGSYMYVLPTPIVTTMRFDIRKMASTF